VHPLPKHAAFVMAAACLALAAAAETPQTLAPLGELKPAPDIVLDIVEGGKLKLSDLRGKVVVVNFWATWCPPCRKEFPSLARVRKRFKSAEFEVLAVNVGEDPDMVFSFTGTTEFPVLFDRDSKAIGSWPVKGLPTTFLVDRAGRLALKAVGGREFDDPEIVAIIKQLLNS